MRSPLFFFACLSIGGCGSAGPEAAFFGVWNFTSGAKEGMSCFTRQPFMESLSGNKAQIQKSLDERATTPQFAGFGFTSCEMSPGNSGSIWQVMGSTAATSLRCIFSGRADHPEWGSSQIYFVKATLSLMGNKTLTFEGTENVKWQRNDDSLVEECVFTFKNAQLSYVGPATEMF